MPDYKHQAKATATMTVEVELRGGGWGGDCTVGQVHEQGSTEARNALSSALHDANKTAGFTKFRILGQPLVECVTSVRRSE